MRNDKIWCPAGIDAIPTQTSRRLFEREVCSSVWEWRQYQRDTRWNHFAIPLLRFEGMQSRVAHHNGFPSGDAQLLVFGRFFRRVQQSPILNEVDFISSRSFCFRTRSRQILPQFCLLRVDGAFRRDPLAFLFSNEEPDPFIL